MIAGLTSGIKSSSSLGKVTGTLSLVLAQAPTLRIFIDTCREDLKHHNWQPQLLFHSLCQKQLTESPVFVSRSFCWSLNWLFRSSLTLMSWNIRDNLFMKSAGIPTCIKMKHSLKCCSREFHSFLVDPLTSLNHSTMFSSFSLSALVSRMSRLNRGCIQSCYNNAKTVTYIQ